MTGESKMDVRYLDALVKSGFAVGLEDPASIFITVRQVPFGDYVCRRGDIADRFWIVVSGRLVAKSPEITRQRPVYESCQIVGERGVLGKMAERVADLVSDDEQTELIEIQIGDVEKHPQNYLLYKNIGAINSDRVLAAYKNYEILAAERAELLETLTRYVGTDFLNRKKLIPADYRNCAKEDAVIWFSDLEGFSKRCANVEASQIAPFLRDALGRQMRAIQSTSGYVANLMGDGIMGYWAARFHDDGANACENSCKAAFDAIKSVSQVDFNGEAIRVRIGLNYGSVFAGDFGTTERAQYTLLGHEVNKAARLESARADAIKSPPNGKLGSVRISASVYDRLTETTKKMFPNILELELKGTGHERVFSSDE